MALWVSYSRGNWCDSYLEVLHYLDAFLAGSLGFGVLLETGSLLDPVYQGPERQHALAAA